MGPTTIWCNAGRCKCGLNSCCACSGDSHTTTSNQANRCLLCPSGRLATLARTQCGGCAAGMREAGPLCAACVSGHYSSTLGSTSCTQCNVGYAPPASSTTCTQCTAGNFQKDAGAASCGPCPSGTMSGVAATACTPIGCTAGKFRSGTACKNCLIGRAKASNWG